MVATSWDPKVQEEFPEATFAMDGNSIVCDTCTKKKRKEVKINCQQPYKAAQYKTHCNSKGHLDAMMDAKNKKQGSIVAFMIRKRPAAPSEEGPTQGAAKPTKLPKTTIHCKGIPPNPHALQFVEQIDVYWKYCVVDLECQYEFGMYGTFRTLFAKGCTRKPSKAFRCDACNTIYSKSWNSSLAKTLLGQQLNTRMPLWL
jgi:hypothetical protein